MRLPAHRKSSNKLYSLLAVVMPIAMILSACTEAAIGTPLPSEPVPIPSQVAGTVTTSLADGYRDVSPDLFGFNTNTIRGPSWSDGDFIKAIRELQPGIIRYPGGTAGNYWDWQRGWIMASSEADFPWDMKGVEPVHNTPAEFNNAATGADFTPIFVLNMLTSDVNYQLAMLKEADRLGMPVKYVGLGNENYLSRYAERFPSGSDYGSEAASWAKAVKEVFPDALVSVSAFAVKATPPNDERRRDWNKGLFDAIQDVPEIEAVTVHVYIDARISRGPDARDERATTTDLPVILGDSFIPDDLMVSTLSAIPDRYQVWITEYNLRDKEHLIHSTWTHGLFAGNLTFRLLEEPRISMLLYHSLVGTSAFTAIFRDETDLLRYDDTVDVSLYGLSATGFIMKQIFNTAHGSEQAWQISFTDNPQVPAADLSYPALTGWCFATGKERRAVILNLSVTENTVDLRNLFATGRYQQYYTDPLRIIGGEEGIEFQTGDIGTSLALPPYSLTVLSSNP